MHLLAFVRDESSLTNDNGDDDDNDDDWPGGPKARVNAHPYDDTIPLHYAYAMPSFMFSFGITPVWMAAGIDDGSALLRKPFEG